MKRLVTLAILLGVLVVGVTSAEAANAGTTVSTYPVSFVLSRDTCKNLPRNTTVTGSGTETSTTTVTTNRHHVTTYVNTTHADGTAKDQAGNHYRFTYDNHFRVSNTVAHPDVVSGLMTDTFSIDGDGPADLSNGFVAEVTTGADLSFASDVWDVRSAFGDPISFKPGAFQFHCDPL